MSQEGYSEPANQDQYESLRRILEDEQQRAVTYEEAAEVGRSLVNFFEVLSVGIEDQQEGTVWDHNLTR
jgi:hypothetical protein